MNGFGQFPNKDLPGPGKLLISEPFLPDLNFKRSVVLLCEHNEEGSVGFILNKKLNIKIADVLEDGWDQDVDLYLGGPVQNDTLHFLHRVPGLDDPGRPLGNGVHWGGDFEEISEKIKNGSVNHQDYRFFLGYSGWSQGQLENEIVNKSWIVAPSDAGTVFDTSGSALWKQILKDLGGNFRLMANYPEDPFLN